MATVCDLKERIMLEGNKFQGKIWREREAPARFFVYIHYRQIKEDNAMAIFVSRKV